MRTEQATISPDVWREAGWATVSVLVGMPAKPAAPCEPTSRRGASLSPSRPPDPRLSQAWKMLDEAEKARFEVEAVAVMAGGAAEAIACGEETRGKRCLWDAAAIHHALLAAEMSQTQAKAFVVQLRDQVEAVLSNPATWAAVQRVATALANRDRLEADEVRQLVAG